MSSTADKMTRILGIDNAQHLLRAFDEEGPTGSVARKAVADFDGVSRDRLAMIELGHAIDRVADLQASANGAFVALKTEHDLVMKGETTGCRHLEIMSKKFWKFIAISFAVPIIVALAIFALSKM